MAFVTASRPVSEALEEALSVEARRSGHVLWLDRDGNYSGFVESLANRSRAGGYPWPVVGFRGSFLETMLALEPYGSGRDKTPLLIHVPGYNKETIKRTPLLEVYESARVWERSLPTLIRETASGRVSPGEIEHFLASGTISLERADQWLFERVSERREGLDGQLGQISPRLLAEELLGAGGRIQLGIAGPEAVAILRSHLERLFGLTPAWFERLKQPNIDALENAKSALWAWLLCVEYVSDLGCDPHLVWLKPLRQLPSGLVEECRRITDALREQAPEQYIRGADEIGELLLEEATHIRAVDLGRIDTFRFELASVFDAAVTALQDGRWDDCLSWTTSRVTKSFWLAREQSSRWEWTLVEAAAQLGQAIARSPALLKGAQALQDAVQSYSSAGFKVDRAHRRLEQTVVRLLEPRLPHFSRVKQAIASVRERYRAWADSLGRSWARLCESHGFLPDGSLRQRELFEQIVEPLVKTGDKVAYFVIDALRYEMASELAEELRSAGTQVDLQARLAELPTVTSVGMNVLAPVAAGGRLFPVVRDGRFGGFKTGEYTVSNPEQRARAMGQRLHGEPALRLDLARIAELDTDVLKRTIAQARGLIVVHGKEIDEAGEAGFGVATFEQSIRQLKAAIGHLQAVGVRHFVVTADHGFLLQDDEGRVRPWGTKRDPTRRYVLTDEQRSEAETHAVSLASLGYDGVSGFLVFLDDTRVFATGVAGATFVHGGNSLQERVIPVLTVSRKRERGSADTAYEIDAKGAKDLLGLRRLQVRVVLARDSQSTLGFTGTAKVDLSIRVPSRSDIQVMLKDVAEPAELIAGRIRVPVGAEPVDVFFALSGPRDERVQVELFYADSAERVAPRLLDGFFDVNGTGIVPAEAAASVARWQDRMERGPALVFEHIDRFGSISEAELVKMLGNPRAVRKFATMLEVYQALVPFEVRVESTANGKSYVKGASRDDA